MKIINKKLQLGKQKHIYDIHIHITYLEGQNFIKSRINMARFMFIHQMSAYNMMLCDHLNYQYYFILANISALMTNLAG